MLLRNNVERKTNAAIALLTHIRESPTIAGEQISQYCEILEEGTLQVDLIENSERLKALNQLINDLREFDFSSYAYSAVAISSNRPDLPMPNTYRQALQSPQCKQWKGAMDEEFGCLIKNGTWSYICRSEVPKDAKVISSKWLYKIKDNPDNSIRFKARLVFRGFEQDDYGETFAPVPKLATIRMLFAIAAALDWNIWQMDVITAFLHPEIDEEVYMELPLGYGIPGNSMSPDECCRIYVCKLNKALYGLKQAPRAWYSDIDAFLISQGFQRSKFDSNLYIMDNLLVLLWVDDILLFSPNEATPNYAALPIHHVKLQLCGKYSMKDLGQAKAFIAIEIERNRKARTIRLHQSKYINGILAQFNMLECNGLSTPLPSNLKLTAQTETDSKSEALDATKTTLYQSIVGKLMYAMIATRPDLAYTVSTLGRFNAAPTKTHLEAAKKVLRYLKQTSTVGITYSGSSFNDLTGFCDSDWAGDLDDRRSTTGYVFSLSGGAISWKSRRQPTVALSSTEAEYMAVTEASKEAIWLRRLYDEILGRKELCPQKILIDNNGAMDLARNPKHHDRTKHIDIRHHFIREAVETKLIELERVASKDNPADLLTKALLKEAHNRHMNNMGLQSKG